MSTGRTTERRAATVSTTSASTTVTAAADTFSRGDVGQPITGTGIPAGATITAYTSSSQVTISAAATATGTPTASIGSATSPPSYGFVGWSPETQTEADSWTHASVNANLPRPDTTQQRSRG